MCGIAGFVVVTPDSGHPSDLRRMSESIRHRGPDDSGFYQDAHAFLAHLRLSIVDLAGGHQPMSNETGSIWITYNGEVFNHALVRPELERAGHIYTSRCDTETIVHAYEQHGPDCVKLFRGMFAFYRDLGHGEENSVLRARPAGNQAAVLLLGRASVRVRLGS